MSNRIKYEIKDEGETITLKVNVDPRWSNKEGVSFFDTRNAIDILLEKKIKYDTIVACPGTSLSNENKGSLRHGEWVFTKEKEVKVATTKQKRPSRRKSENSRKAVRDTNTTENQRED